MLPWIHHGKEICPTCPAAPPLFSSYFLSILGFHSFYYLDLLSIPYEKTQIVKTFTILTTAADVGSWLQDSENTNKSLYLLSFFGYLSQNFYYLDLFSIPYHKMQIVKTFTILTTGGDVAGLLWEGSLSGVFPVDWSLESGQGALFSKDLQR